MKLTAIQISLVIACIGLGALRASAESPTVLMKTSLGDIEIALDPGKAPRTVENFLSYVDEGHYDATIFHRVIKGFMIQGGGFTQDLVQKETRPPIRNEAGNGLKNNRGTIAMARTTVVDSATAQFFINVVDNDSLNHRDSTPDGFGYAVFGHVIDGIEVVDKIKSVKTTIRNRMSDVPVNPVIIHSITRVNTE